MLTCFTLNKSKHFCTARSVALTSTFSGCGETQRAYNLQCSVSSLFLCLVCMHIYMYIYKSLPRLLLSCPYFQVLIWKRPDHRVRCSGAPNKALDVLHATDLFLHCFIHLFRTRFPREDLNSACRRDLKIIKKYFL